MAFLATVEACNLRQSLVGLALITAALCTAPEHERNSAAVKMLLPLQLSWRYLTFSLFGRRVLTAYSVPSTALEVQPEE